MSGRASKFEEFSGSNVRIFVYVNTVISEYLESFHLPSPPEICGRTPLIEIRILNSFRHYQYKRNGHGGREGGPAAETKLE